MARFCEELTAWSTDLNNQKIVTSGGYTPKETDVIMVTAFHANGNVKAWVEWDSSVPVWRVKVSDSSYTGKILYIIRTI